MTWYYAIGNERQGPVDDATLDRLIAAGTVTPDTLVWRAGMADWQPLSQARPTVARPAPIPPVPAGLPSPAATTTPAAGTPAAGTPASGDVSGQPRFGTPAFGSPHTYGTAGTGPGTGAGAAGGDSRGAHLGAEPTEDAEEAYARIVGTGRSFAIGDVISRGWNVVSANLGLAIGAAALTMVVLLVASVIPCVGSIVNLVIQGPMIAGLWVIFLKLHRTGSATFEDLFAGFQMFLPLFLVTLVQTLITMVAMIPAMGLFFLGGVLSKESEALGIMVMAVGALVGIVPAIYLGVSWVFSLPLVVDKKLDFWPAMELSRKVVAKRFFNVFGLLICVGLIAIAGLIALCVGIFVAIPLGIASLAAAYEDLFGHTVPRTTV
jgi:hypothetical protein